MGELVSEPNNSAHLSPERIDHRTWIKGRVATLLGHYWREDDDPALLAAMGKDWADVLEGLPQEYIQRACVAYLREETRKPKPCDIYERARQMMPKPKPVQRTEPQLAEPRVTAEQATAILEQAGFLPKRFGEGAK